LLLCSQNPPLPSPPPKTTGIEALRDKRDAISRQIAEEEAERARLQQDALALQRRLGLLADSLAKKREARDEYDRVVEQTEAAYAKIVESSHTLLHVLKREATAIAKRRGGGASGGGGVPPSGNGGGGVGPGAGGAF
jgi:Sjoegren syndrome nuclear autoantigen 1